MKPLILLFVAFVISGCITPSKEKLESDAEMAIWNNPNIDQKTKEEILKAKYLERISKQKTQHDSSEYRPVVDLSKCKTCPYDKDLATCSNIAREHTNYARNAINNAAGGAVTGAIFGAIVGLDVGMLAAAGAAGGGLGGLGNEAITVRQMVINCMRGRGYSVLR